MRKRFLMAAAVVALIATTPTLTMANEIDPSQPNCVGRHTSEMAREHGGLKNATQHHNEIHGDDLSVGEHQALIRDGCGG